ncbi:TonB-dependent receptor [Sphingobium sp. AP49]|uniref:TonB-dependent receptor n=1 Tax=Sphingobium sp. AP49 TaxID=1144307 RepID=UPI00026EDF1F|nr:TonB-dependent receptor [Sphingobium sp. AP49]WHO39864.1 TonB-dependent receptor [Sphingobium sp. AP49]
MTIACEESRVGSGRGRLIRVLLMSASAAGSIVAAQAQDAPASAAPQGAAGEEASIVVTGYRQSIEQSLRQKREANAFVDVITAEDIGKFPDKNVADSLQRVPGVIIERDGGEGSKVSIRGLSSDLTLTQLNGNFIASADSGDPSRSFNYTLLPANMIASVDVFKSPEARMDEGGVGGTVILKTRRPLDLEPWSGFLSAEGVYADVSDKFEPQISGQLSWHNPDDTFGVLVGATYQERRNRTLTAGTETWAWWTYDRANEPATDVNGNPYANDSAISYWSENTGSTTQDGTRYSGYWAPQSVTESVLDQQRKRLGIQATAQWKPTDELTLTANYFRFQIKNNFQSNVLKIPEWGYRNFFTGASFDDSGTIMQGANFHVPAAGTGCLTQTPACTMETPQLSGQYSREKVTSNTFDINGEYEHDRLKASFVVGKTKATGGPSMRFSVAAKPRLTTASQSTNGNFMSDWSFKNGSLDMQFSPELQQNLMNGIAQIDTGSTGSSFTNSTIQQTYAQIDLTREFDGFFNSLQVGGKYRDGKVRRETGRVEWYADPATKLRYQDTPAGAVAQPGYFYDKPIGNIDGGFTASAFPGINFRNYLDYLNSTYGDPVHVTDDQNIYNIGEKIWAGYAQLNFKTDSLRGNLGMRIVNTKQTGTSTDTLYYEDDYCVNGPGGPFSPPPMGPDGNCQVIPQDQRERRVFSPNDESKSYTDFLPSFNVSWEVQPDLVLRGAIAKVIARPGYNDLAGARSLTYNSDAFVYDRQQFGARPGWFGNGGNFDLKPFSAWQYDVGVEWYFHQGSVLGATLFRKDVSDFIVPVVLDLTQTVAGETVVVQQYSTQANGSKAKSQGIELYAQHTFSFGLGAQVNFTYNDTSVADIAIDGQKVGTSPLVGSAKTQVNASVFWETDKFLVRASYNRRGEVVRGIASGLNIYDDPYEQVDLNASYNINDKLSLTASIINLTKSEQRQHLGNDTKDRFYSNVYAGRRAYVGVTYNF